MYASLFEHFQSDHFDSAACLGEFSWYEYKPKMTFGSGV